MLVRVSHTKVEGSKSLDEHGSRTQRNLQHEALTEFNVVWRQNRIELYEAHVSQRIQTVILMKCCSYFLGLSGSLATIIWHSLCLFDIPILTYRCFPPPTCHFVWHVQPSLRFFRRDVMQLLEDGHLGPISSFSSAGVALALRIGSGFSGETLLLVWVTLMITAGES